MCEGHPTGGTSAVAVCLHALALSFGGRLDDEKLPSRYGNGWQNCLVSGTLRCSLVQIKLHVIKIQCISSNQAANAESVTTTPNVSTF